MEKQCLRVKKELPHLLPFSLAKKSTGIHEVMQMNEVSLMRLETNCAAHAVSKAAVATWPQQILAIIEYGANVIRSCNTLILKEISWF